MRVGHGGLARERNWISSLISIIFFIRLSGLTEERVESHLPLPSVLCYVEGQVWWVCRRRGLGAHVSIPYAGTSMGKGTDGTYMPMKD